MVLRRLRKASGLTQEELALEAELRRTYVSILELGQQQPTLTTILKLAPALGKREWGRRAARAARSLINGLIRDGRLEASGSNIRRS